MSSNTQTPGARPPDSGFRVTSSVLGAQHVSLWGAMPVGWLGNFTRGASRMHLDIVRGRARRQDARRWSGEFEMRAAEGTALEHIDFLNLARAASSGDNAGRLAIRSFELVRSDARAGALELRVRARDRVGFLASLLSHLAGFVLFPQEIEIETHQQEARDALWLSSVGGQSPPPQLEEALRASLLDCAVETA